MKTKIQLLSSLFCLILLVLPAHGQGVYEWGPTFPITDSLTFNSNPVGWWLSYNQELAILYEKKMCDTCNTDIWFRNLTTMDPETPLLTNNEVHYNPVFISGYANEFLGFVIYLSNGGGDTNIFVTKIENDLTHSNTTQLTFTNTTKSNLIISQNSYIKHLGWIEDSCVWTALPVIENNQITLSEITKLDSLRNTSVVIGLDNAYFQRKVGDSLHIFGRKYEYDIVNGSGYWNETYPVKTSGNNTDLTVDKSEFSFVDELIWLTNNQVHGYSYSNYSGGFEFVLNTCNLPNIQHPSYIMWDLVVKDEWMPHVLLYATGEGNNAEIYGSFSEYGNSPDTTNLTNDGLLDSNPNLFWGEYDGTMSFWIYGVWQSHRNDHVALYGSKFLGFIEGGVDEHPDTGITVSVHPNPFVSEVQINLSSISGEEILVSVYSLSGKPVWQHTIPADNQPTQSCVWVPDPNVPKGIYVVVVNQDGDQTSQRVVYK